MGASQRKEAVAFFNGFATSSTPPDAAELTAQLTLFSAGLCSGSELYSLAFPIVERLVEVNPETGRVRWLLQYCNTVLGPIVSNSQAADGAGLAALRVTELMMRVLPRVMKGESAKLLVLLETTGSTGKDGKTEADGTNSEAQVSHHEDPAKQLCVLLMQYVVEVPLDSSRVPTHAAVVRLLLTLTSSALHHSTQFSEAHIDVFTEIIMSADVLTPFISVLLDRTVAWGAGVEVASPPLYAETCEPGFRGLLSIFGGGRGSGAAVAAPAAPSPAQASMRVATDSSAAAIAPFFSVTEEKKDAAKNVFGSCSSAEITLRHSASLLSLLVAHQKGNGRNPALEYIRSLKNGDALPFARILSSLASALSSSPAVCMLLYVLLHDHPTFLHDVLHADEDALLSSVEKILLITHMANYIPPTAVKRVESSAPAAAAVAVDVPEDPLELASLGRIEWELTRYAYPFVNFMTSTLLLLLSQDRVVIQLMSDGKGVPVFVVDRHQQRGAKVPMSSLALQVLCASIVKALNDRNEPLAAVFVPCMANIAVFANNLDTYTSQRIVGLLQVTLRKIKIVDAAYRAAEQIRSRGAEGAGAAKPEVAPRHNAYSQEDMESLESLGDMFVRQLRMVVEAVEGMLRGRDRNNAALIYELLYARDKLIGPAGSDEADGTGDAGAVAVTVESGTRHDLQIHEIMRNLTRLISGYEAELASATSAASPKEILAIIENCARDGGSGLPQGNSAAIPTASEKAGKGASTAASGSGYNTDLLYSYEESPHSYDFFGPYVWSTLLSDGRWPGGVLWAANVSDLALFPQ